MANMTTGLYTQKIKQEAYRLGFDFVGISKARRLDQDAKRLEEWLGNKGNAKMAYMENHFEKRVDPRKLVEGARSVISLLYNYHTEEEQEDKTAPRIAKYAFGEDYHFVVKDKLKALFSFMEEEIGAVEGRFFVDSAPVLDRAWARESGLGWIGKNSMLINRQRGSNFFIAELIVNLDLEYDGPIKDYCGTCTRCIEACPTDAILPQRQIDSARCISYLTIELKDETLPGEFSSKMNNWAFGCDICQDVCPWNRFAEANKELRFKPKQSLLEMRREDWENIEKETFNELFKNSAIKRTKFSGLKRNIAFIKK